MFVVDLQSADFYMVLSRVYNFYECSKSAQLSCLNSLDRSWSSHNFQYGGTPYYVGTPTYSGNELYLVFSIQSHPWGSPNSIPSEQKVLS